MHGKRDRRIGDGCPPDFAIERRKQDICLLLDHIHGFYKAALDRLPMPSLAPRLLEAGMCIGFVDPVSNIIVNTIAYIPPPTPSPTPLRGSGEEETRESILSKIITDTNDKFVFEVPLSRHKADGMTIARRSLDGLVSFLTSHYRYLAGTEALHYLRLAKADLLAAVRLVERDRNKKRNDELAFSIASHTTRVALECAALSARHPKPGVLVKASMIMASPQADRTVLHAGQDPSLAEFLREGHMSMDRSLDVCGKEKKNRKKRKRSQHTSRATESIEGSSAHSSLVSQPTFRYTQSLKLLLLGKIHGIYLQALAKLPRDGLRKRHHGSLLKCGYCYGPRDPVSNIILNTIWYGSMFPTPQEFEIQFKVDMICTNMLARIECCSLYGLVAFLRTCFPSLTEHDAVSYLFSSDADVRKAIHKVKRHGHALSDSYHNAYRKAAVASWHPDPDALVKFAMSSLDMESAKLLAILQGTLTNDSVECLARSLPQTESEEKLNQLTSSSQVLSKKQRRFVSELRKKFKHDQNFFVRKVKAALSKYSQQKGVHYELHIICGVNPKVPKGSSCGPPKKNFKFEYSHINFLATAKAPNSAMTAPELFFAQCSNSIKETRERPSWCIPVSYSCMDNVRCFSCEFNGAKIVHPHEEAFCGYYEDFILMASGKHGFQNEHVINYCHFNVDKMATLTADFIYFDPNMDSKIVEMNPISSVARELREWKGRIF